MNEKDKADIIKRMYKPIALNEKIKPPNNLELDMHTTHRFLYLISDMQLIYFQNEKPFKELSKLYKLVLLKYNKEHEYYNLHKIFKENNEYETQILECINNLESIRDMLYKKYQKYQKSIWLKTEVLECEIETFDKFLNSENRFNINNSFYNFSYLCFKIGGKMNLAKYIKLVILSLVTLWLWLILWYFWSLINLTIILNRLPLSFNEVFYYFNKNFSILMSIISVIGLLGISLFWYYRHHKFKKKNKITNNAQFLTEKEFTSIFKEVFFLQKQANHGFVVRLQKEQYLFKANVINNTHGLIIGKTGSGKTQNIIIPTIIFNAYSLYKPSMIITDPKGELFSSQSKLLKEQGYNIKVLDLKNFQIGDYWNPLLVIFNLWKENKNGEAQRQIDVIINAICPIPLKINDPHWITTSQNFIKGIIFALLEDYDQGFNISENNFNFKTLATIIHQERKKIKSYLLERNKKSRARQYCSNLLIESDDSKEIDSLFSSTKTILNKFTNINIETLLSKNTINFQDFQEKPTVIFLIVADYSLEYHSLANLFIQQLYKHLVLIADNNENKTLKRPVYFLCDEFANMPTITGFNNIISASCSRNIWWLLITQDLEQLRHKYGTVENILSNCDLQIYIHTNNFNSAKLLSQTYGTTKIKSTSISSHVKNKSITTHDKDEFLISANELLKLPENSQIIKYNSYNPGKVQTLPIWKIRDYHKGSCDNINIVKYYQILVYDIEPFLKKSKEKKHNLQSKLNWLMKQTEISENGKTI